jgi:uridine kinase
VRVGIDGVDGSGKTTFANELSDVLQSLGRKVIRVSVDDFHNIRELRYRRGRSSPEGFWLDAFDYDRLRADVLEPLGPGGSRRYRPAAHDLASDQVLDPRHEVAQPERSSSSTAFSSTAMS